MDLLHSGGKHDPIAGVTVAAAGEVAERHDEPRRHQPLCGVLGQVNTVSQGPRAGVVFVVVEPPHLEGAVHVVAVSEVAQHAEVSGELCEDGPRRRRGFYVSRLPGVLGIGPRVVFEASADIVFGEGRQRQSTEGFAGEGEGEDSAVIVGDA